MNEPGPDGLAVPSSSASTTVGAKLAAARQALDMSVADVARQIKLSVPQVEAIEADDLARLPKSAVIVKGFLRNYAKLVQLDPDALLGHVHPEARSGEATAGKSRMRPVPLDHTPRSWRKPLSVAAVMAALLVAGYGLYLNSDLLPLQFLTRLKPTELAATSAVPSPTHAARGETSPSTSTVQDLTSPAVPAVPRIGESVPGVPASERTQGVATEPPPTAAAASGQGIVRLKFDRDSWVEIKDRDGNRIFSQINRGGTEQSVQGIPPLQLVIGSAGGVRVTWNNQPVDLAPYSKVDVARFTLE